MTLPSQETIAQTIFDSGNVPDPDEIFLALEDMERRIAKNLINQLTNLYEDLTIHTEYRPDAKSAVKDHYVILY